MKPRPPLPPAPYLVVGQGLSGRAVAALLDDAIVVENDVEGMQHLDSVKTVVKSPGIRPSVELIRLARERGKQVVGELEIAWRALPNEFIAVTGTNGKTTTTALLGEIHRLAGIPHAVAGNIGTALSSLVGSIDHETVVICECSSFQLADSLAFAPEAAVLLNVDADHLDWHGSVGAYREAKHRIFVNQEPTDVAVVPRGYDRPVRGQRIEYEPAEPHEVRLRGRHNLENAGAARAAARARGIDEDAIARALAEFGGVPHRLEEVAVIDGVTYINDAKGEDFGLLRQDLVAHCRSAYLIGQAGPRLHADLTGALPLIDCGTLEVAVERASADARAGEFVLLSPACASYDQFRNFEERGERFRELVNQLKDGVRPRL